MHSGFCGAIRQEPTEPGVAMQSHLLIPLALVPAKLLGGVANRMRIPAVVGEIAAGVLLGPALLGWLPSEASAGEGPGVFHDLAQIGLCVLLFKIGLETRLSSFLAIWKPATVTAVAGMVLPFLFGWGLALAWGSGQLTAIFVGATLTATSIGVTASVIAELRAESTREATVILGAAVLDDVLGLLLLSVLVGMVTPGIAVAPHVTMALLQAGAFMAGGIWLGPCGVQFALTLSRWCRSQAVLLALAFGYLLLMAWLAEVVGLSMLIGAYAAGLAFAGHRERKQLEEGITPLVELLTPLFFVLIGASISFDGFSLSTAEGRDTWAELVLLVIFAIAGKLAAGFLLRRDDINRLAVGSGMVPRGEVGLIFAQVGLTTGVFGSEQFSVLAMAIVITTVVGPLLLRFFWRREAVSTTEQTA